jgi:hypothetical protein
MSATKNIASLIGGAAVAAAAIGLTAGLTPAAAAPAQNGANLAIAQDPANPANLLVAVFGTFPMNGYDAHGFINNLNNGYAPGGMRFELYGDDNGEGDRTVTLNRWFAGADTKSGGLYATDTGIHYRRDYVVPKSDLNEDDAFYNDIDEVYAKATFVDCCWGNRSQYSNVVVGQF